MATTRHGTLAGYTTDGCRCQECCAANTTYRTTRYRQIAYGRWDSLISPQAAAQHVQALRDAGMTVEAIASAARLGTTTINRLAYPSHAGHYRELRESRSAAILAVRVGHRGVAPTLLVPAVGTTRRIHGLARMGWTAAAVGAHLGITGKAVSLITTRTRVTAETATRIEAVHRDLAMRPGPSDTSRRRAAARGWAPPLAWDDDTIDDPWAVPNFGDARPLRTLAVLDDGADCGWTWEQAAAHLDVQVDSLRTTCRRAQRHDLIRSYDRARLPACPRPARAPALRTDRLDTAEDGAA
jgi:hypothetical protein